MARAVPAALCAMAAGFLLMIALEIGPGPVQIGLFALGFSIGGAIYTLGPAIIGEITPPGQRGTLLGVLTGIYSLAGLAAPLVTGRIIATASSAPQGYRDAFLLAGALVVAGGLAGLILIRPEADLARA
jgi:MFS family permease